MIDLEKALLEPASVFRSPRQVVESQDISREHKIEILQRWYYDLSESMIAGEQGTANEIPVSVNTIIDALHSLDAKRTAD